MRRDDALQRALDLVALGVLVIDNQGQIWRCKHQNRLGDWLPNAPKRAEFPGNKGYLRLVLVDPDNKPKTFSVMAHRVVWVHSNGPYDPKLEINHKDLNKTNNALSNLELMTGVENMKHSRDHGRTVAYGLRRKTENPKWRGKAMITDAQKAEIRALRGSGKTYKEISQSYGITIGRVWSICHE